MLLFWPCTQRSCSGGEGQGRKGVGGSWQHPPILLETELSLWPCPRPHFSSPCSHPDQVFRFLASLSWDGNEQSSASPARPVRDLVLCVPQHLTCQHYAPSSQPHPNSRVSSFPSLPCIGHRNHSCPYSVSFIYLRPFSSLFSDSPGLCHGP